MTDATPHDPTVLRLERTFSAPAQTVFDAWTSAEMLRRWWPAGPSWDWDTPVADVDLRVGGAVRLVMRSPDGVEFGGTGEYLEMDPPTRLVFSWTWDGRDGTQLVEVDFHENADGTTTVVLTNSGLIDEADQRSHYEGWQASFDNLDRALAA